MFPKRYTWNQDEPPLLSIRGHAAEQVGFHAVQSRSSSSTWKSGSTQLRDLGIEADIILLHPYDEGHWGFDRMPDEVDDRYLKYVVSRLGAFRNVWWSLANEYDFMTEKQEIGLGPDDRRSCTTPIPTIG